MANWATDPSTGPTNEGSQGLLKYEVTADNTGLFAGQPAISTGGTLTYEPAEHAYGETTVTVRLQDDGGTERGGVDTSEPQTFTIKITGINDAPSFTMGTDQTVNEDAGAQSVTEWATNISAGPNESGQTLTFGVTAEDTTLFAVEPKISADGTLTYEPAEDANGETKVWVTLTDDGGTEDGGVDNAGPAQFFMITITAVNDAPSFTKGADQELPEDSPAQTVANWATSIKPGPDDEIGQTLTFEVSNDNPDLFAVQPAIGTDGTLTYTPEADAHGTATVTLSLKDGGGTANGGADTSAPQSFTIELTSVNDLPAISAVADQATEMAVATGEISFTVDDLETAEADLVITATSSDQTLLPDANIMLGGTGADRTILLTPAAGETGITTITLSVDDGTDSVQTTFDLAVYNLFLSNIETSVGDLSPAFSPETLTYSVGYRGASQVRVTPTAADPAMEIRVNGTAVASGTASPAIPLSRSTTTVTLVVTAPGTGVSRTYTITYNFMPLSGNADLASLSVSAGELSPPFSSGVTSYEVIVPPNVTSVSVQATAAHAAARVTVQGGSDLQIGDNTVQVVVTAENGSQKTYSITVRRQRLAISGVQVSTTSTSATFSFETTIPASATIAYGVNSLSEGSVSAGGGRNHSATLSGLQPGTTYSYQITATAPSGANATSSGSFTTAGQSQPIVTCPGGEIRIDESGKVWVYCPASDETRRSVEETLPPLRHGEVSVTHVSETYMAEALAAAGQNEGEAPRVRITSGVEGSVSAAVIDSTAVQMAAEAGAALEIDSPHGTLVISPEALSALSEDLGDSQLVIRYADIQSALSPAPARGRALRQASPVVDVSVLMIHPDGTVDEYSQFRVPFQLALQVDLATVSNPDLLGIYLLVEDEEGNVVDQVYVGGELDEETGTITASRDHLSKYVAMVYVSPFRDVPETHWAHDTIMVMAAQQIAVGITPDEFQPDAPITRVDFAATLVRALRLEQDGALATGYSDIPADDPMAGYIGGALKAGLMNGYPDGTFRPDALITRQEMAVVLTRMLKLYGLNGQVGPKGAARVSAFQDLTEIGDWAMEAVKQVVDRGLMTGRPGPTFVPGGNTTRAEAVTVLKRLLDLRNQ